MRAAPNRSTSGSLSREGTQVSYVLPPLLSDFNIDDDEDETELDLRMDLMDSVPLYEKTVQPPKVSHADWRRGSTTSACDDGSDDDVLEEVLSVTASASVTKLGIGGAENGNHSPVPNGITMAPLRKSARRSPRSSKSRSDQTEAATTQDWHEEWEANKSPTRSPLLGPRLEPLAISSSGKAFSIDGDELEA